MNTARPFSRGTKLLPFFKGTGRLQRGTAWGAMIIGALLAFEIFNYSTTEFALKDVLGNLSFAGVHWATILAIAFCGIDFAGIARLFTPEQGRDEPAEVWYLFGAWMLAAAMNATLTWWGVSVAIASHQSMGSAVVSPATMTKVVPVFVAVMVWLIRVLIIGTFSLAGDRLFSQVDSRRSTGSYERPQPQQQPARPATNLGNLRPASSLRSAPRSASRSDGYRQEPTYHNVSMSARSAGHRDDYTQ
jgi:hypothetical protein